jgi:hypothetical protein
LSKHRIVFGIKRRRVRERERGREEGRKEKGGKKGEIDWNKTIILWRNLHSTIIQLVMKYKLQVDGK